MNKTKLKQLNFKVSPDFYWQLKNFATSKRLKMAEVLEKAFSFYEKREVLVKEINLYDRLFQQLNNSLNLS